MQLEDGQICKIYDELHIGCFKNPEGNGFLYLVFEIWDYSKKNFHSFCLSSATSPEEALKAALAVLFYDIKKYRKIKEKFEELDANDKQKDKIEKFVKVSKDFSLKEMGVPKDQYEEFGPYLWAEVMRDEKTGKYLIGTDCMIFTSKTEEEMDRDGENA